MAAVCRGGWDVSQALCKKERLEVLMNALQSLPQTYAKWSARLAEDEACESGADTALALLILSLISICFNKTFLIRPAWGN